jgi:hypothetical protein
LEKVRTYKKEIIGGDAAKMKKAFRLVLVLKEELPLLSLVRDQITLRPTFLFLQHFFV